MKDSFAKPTSRNSFKKKNLKLNKKKKIKKKIKETKSQ